MKILTIVNPGSGRQKYQKFIKKAEAFFNKHKLENEILITKSEEDIEKIILEKSSFFTDILVCGGDGTVNLAVNALMKLNEKPTLSIYPLGTTNDLSRILNIKKNVNQNFKNAFIKQNNDLIDINQINDHYFLYVGAAGYLTNITYEISSKNKIKYGYFAYIKEGLKNLSNMISFKVKIKTNDQEHIIESPFLLFLSAGTFGALNLKKVEQDIKLNDGLIQFRAFLERKRIKNRLLNFVLSMGRNKRKQIDIKSDYFEITCLENKPIAWNCDGEKYEANKVVIKVIKKAFPITVGKKALKKFF